MVKVERKYLSGEFHCKYNGTLVKEYDSSGEAIYSIDPYEYEIVEAVPSGAAKPYVPVNIPIHQFHGLPSVPIRLSNGNGQEYFKESVVDVLLYDIQLLKVNKEERLTYGTLKAKIHCAVERVEEIPDDFLIDDDGFKIEPLDGPPGTNPPKPDKGKPTTGKGPAIFGNAPSRWSFGSILGFILGLFFFLWLVTVLVASWHFVLPIIGFLVGIWLLNLVSNFVSVIFNRLLPLAYFFFLCFLGYSFFNSFSGDELVPKVVKENPLEEADEKTETKVATATNPTDGTQLPTDTLISHHRVWQDYENHKYEGDLAILQTDYRSSRQNREKQEYELENTESWYGLYNQLEQFDQTKLKRVVSMLDSIRRSNSFTERQFADVVVSCIQDIPYVLVHPYSCEEISRHDGYANSYHRENLPCMANVKFGVQAPAEYMANLNADCDTRTLLLYSVLNSFGYDVVILGSAVYSHAVLGINLPATGAFKMVQGKRYYLWETTARGMQLGQIAPEQNNMNNWDIMLMNKPNNNFAVL